METFWLRVPMETVFTLTKLKYISGQYAHNRKYRILRLEMQYLSIIYHLQHTPQSSNACCNITFQHKNVAPIIVAIRIFNNNYSLLTVTSLSKFEVYTLRLQVSGKFDNYIYGLCMFVYESIKAFIQVNDIRNMLLVFSFVIFAICSG